MRLRSLDQALFRHLKGGCNAITKTRVPALTVLYVFTGAASFYLPAPPLPLCHRFQKADRIHADLYSMRDTLQRMIKRINSCTLSCLLAILVVCRALR